MSALFADLRAALADYDEWPTVEKRARVIELTRRFVGAVDQRTAVIEQMRAQVTPSEQAVSEILQPRWQCVCAGQGGDIYSAQCPIHDSHVDTTDPIWRKWYDAHLDAQRRIKERLRW